MIWEEKWIDPCLRCATAQVLSVPGRFMRMLFLDGLIMLEQLEMSKAEQRGACRDDREQH